MFTMGGFQSRVVFYFHIGNFYYVHVVTFDTLLCPFSTHHSVLLLCFGMYVCYRLLKSEYVVLRVYPGVAGSIPG